MTNNVMRVRGSLGLKLPSDEIEKGSDLIETDSSATARVEAAETLINVGLMLGAADAGNTPPPRMTARPAHMNARMRSLEAKARFLIGLCSLCQKRKRTNRHEAGKFLKSLVEGPPGNLTLVHLNIHIALVSGQQLLDGTNKKLYEAF
jgi:hypothetical protein